MHLDRHDGRQALSHILALEVRVGILEHGRAALIAAVIVDHARQRGLEAHQMRAALGGVDIIGEGVNVLSIAVVILQRGLDGHAVLYALDVNRLREEHLAVFIEEFDKLADTALIVENALLLPALALIAQHDLDALVQKGHLAHAGFEDIVVKLNIRIEHAVGVLFAADIGPELHRGARALARIADNLQIVFDLAAIILLAVYLAALIYRNHQVTGQRVYNRRAHAVQAAGHLVALAAKLAARVQHGQAYLHRGTPHLGMDAHREAAAVILHLYRAIVLDGDDDIRAVAGQRLVHGVVHNFIYAMMQSAVIGRADIHAGTAAHSLQPLQHLNIACAVMALRMIRILSCVHFFRHFDLPGKMKHAARRPQRYAKNAACYIESR